MNMNTYEYPILTKGSSDPKSQICFLKLNTVFIFPKKDKHVFDKFDKRVQTKQKQLFSQFVSVHIYFPNTMVTNNKGTINNNYN
jgi:hypothetical protein